MLAAEVAGSGQTTWTAGEDWSASAGGRKRMIRSERPAPDSLVGMAPGSASSSNEPSPREALPHTDFAALEEQEQGSGGGGGDDNQGSSTSRRRTSNSSNSTRSNTSSGTSSGTTSSTTNATRNQSNSSGPSFPPLPNLASTTTATSGGGGQATTTTQNAIVYPSGGTTAAPSDKTGVDCQWGQWSAFSNCSVSCGGGFWSRKRVVLVSSSNGGRRCSDYSPGNEEFQSCNPQNCPINCTWGDWTSWSLCSAGQKTCGPGSSGRYREVLVKAKDGGSKCTGDTTESKACNLTACPVDCKWNNWGGWTSCTATCGGGARQRNRTQAVVDANGGKLCEGGFSEWEQCKTQTCPTDCMWGQWGQWSACSKPCAIGERTRSRSVSVEAKDEGKPCTGGPTDTSKCNVVGCPVNCMWNDWGQWSGCAATCGSSKEARSRTKVQEQQNGGTDCQGSRQEDRNCSQVLCPVDCKFGEWAQWSACSATCNGNRVRARSMYREQVGGKPCQGNTTDTGRCGTCGSNTTRAANSSGSGSATWDQLMKNGTATQGRQNGTQGSGPQFPPLPAKWTQPRSANASACFDVPGWADSSGINCQTYVEKQYCTTAGGYGSGWSIFGGTFDEYQNRNYSAVTACCECGGGIKASQLASCPAPFPSTGCRSSGGDCDFVYFGSVKFCANCTYDTKEPITREMAGQLIPPGQWCGPKVGTTSGDKYTGTSTSPGTGTSTTTSAKRTYKATGSSTTATTTAKGTANTTTTAKGDTTQSTSSSTTTANKYAVGESTKTKTKTSTTTSAAAVQGAGSSTTTSTAATQGAGSSTTTTKSTAGSTTATKVTISTTATKALVVNSATGYSKSLTPAAPVVANASQVSGHMLISISYPSVFGKDPYAIKAMTEAVALVGGVPVKSVQLKVSGGTSLLVIAFSRLMPGIVDVLYTIDLTMINATNSSVAANAGNTTFVSRILQALDVSRANVMQAAITKGLVKYNTTYTIQSLALTPAQATSSGSPYSDGRSVRGAASCSCPALLTLLVAAAASLLAGRAAGG